MNLLIMNDSNNSFDSNSNSYSSTILYYFGNDFMMNHI